MEIFMELTVMKETGKELICFCPYHRDEGTPNFHILKVPHNGFPIGFAKCFACGMAKQFTEEEVKELSKRPATKASKCENIDWWKLTRFYFHYYNSASHGRKLCDKWKVRGETVSLFKIGWDSYDKTYTVPMCNEYKEIIGIRKFRLGGTKYCVSGSQQGLFLSTDKHTDLDGVVVVEGLSDAAIARECGFLPVGKPSAAFGNDLVLKYLQNNNIKSVTVVCDDNDKPYKEAIGQREAHKLDHILKQNGIKSKVLKLFGAKDLRELYQKKGKEHCKRILSL